MTDGGEKILLVEDDSMVSTTVVTFLELEGFSVSFHNTRDAIERLSRRRLPPGHF